MVVHFFIYVRGRPLDPKTLKPRVCGGGGFWPTGNLKAYTSGIECRIDLKPGCKFKFFRSLEIYLKTRASRTTGAKGSNCFARNNRFQIGEDHMERIRLQVSANNK